LDGSAQSDPRVPAPTPDQRDALSLGHRALLIVFLALVGWAALAAVGVYFMDRHFIFFPDRALEATPAAAGLPFEDVTFTASDGVKLEGWFIPAPNPHAPSGARPFTLVMFHGNAGNISHRIDWAKLFRDRLDSNVFLFDYRGYGKSEGSPTEKGTYLDGEAAVEMVAARPDVDASRIIYTGHSLGAAVATEVALRLVPAGLVLESPFTSVADMAKQVIPFLPVGRFLSTRYETEKKIARLACPLLVIHGDRDEAIPFEHAIRVYREAPEPKSFFRVMEGGHNDTYIVGGEAYVQAYVRFLASIGSRGPKTAARRDGPVPVGEQ
jgi:fermentation-respiration switch protein FrsA (DUF1100 family)